MDSNMVAECFVKLRRYIVKYIRVIKSKNVGMSNNN